jgi:uncharacterized protein YutE (UPF0331/DUF86 family)
LNVPDWDDDQTVAFGTYVQNAYAGMERVLQYILKKKGETIPKSPMWHYDLLKLSQSCGLIPSEAQLVLENLMKFRHRHVHGYGHMLDETKLRDLALPITRVFDIFSEHIEKISEELH